MKSIINRISEDLCLDPAYITRLIDHADYYYKSYEIPKRTGGFRKISQASPELKTLQYWCKNNILCLLPISSAATAYNRKNSIKSNAELHKHSQYFFHADIVDFFPNTKSEYLNKIIDENLTKIQNAGFQYDDINEVVSKICFKNNQLCIGTVSSPMICNIVMNHFDIEMMRYCEKHNYIYSRYADDIYISSNSFISDDLYNYVNLSLNKNEYKINKKKTAFISKKGHCIITGVTITDDSELSIGTKNKKLIKKYMYEWLVKKKGSPKILLGYLSFLKDIEPNTYDAYMIKYSKYCENDVLSAIILGIKEDNY